MGLFDTVIVPCPSCGETSGFQSKSGPCSLLVYTLDDAPDDVLNDVNRHSPNRCMACGTLFGVELGEPPMRRTITAKAVKWSVCGVCGSEGIASRRCPCEDE